jgi:hypothetical protein
MTPIKLNTVTSFGACTLLTLALIFTSGLGLCLSYESHSPEYGHDFDFFGRHACPDKTNKAYRAKLPPGPTRPDEDILWNESVKAFLEEELLSLPQIEKEYRADALIRQAHERASLFRLENCYRVEVRRTILELEANHRIWVFPACYRWSDYELLHASPFGANLGCGTGYPETDLAHDRGRSATLLWYLKHGLPPHYSPPTNTHST